MFGGGKAPEHIEGPIWRAACGRLWLHLEKDPMDGRVEELDVVRALECSMGAVFDRRRMVAEVLQEDWILPFTVDNERLTLDRDFWSGLTILAGSNGADAVVLKIRDLFAASPPSKRGAGDESTVVSKEFLDCLRREPGAADLTCWQ